MLKSFYSIQIGNFAENYFLVNISNLLILVKYLIKYKKLFFFVHVIT